MGSSIQQYCLRWNNHRSNLLLVFEHLFHTEAFTDVTLACDGASIKCHKMVLAACSSYFQQLFMDNDCRHPIVILKDIKFTEMKAILEYMYKGEVNVAQDQLAGLLKAAETLKVKGLVEDQQQQQNQGQPQQRPLTTSPPSSRPPSVSHPSQLQQGPQQLLPTGPVYPSTIPPQSNNHSADPYSKTNCLPPRDKFTPPEGHASGGGDTCYFNKTANCLPSNKFPGNDWMYERDSFTPSETTRGGLGGNGGGGPIWSSGKHSLPPSPRHCLNSGNVSTNHYDHGQTEPVPLKKKKFLSSSGTKDTPILRTVLGHTSSQSHSHPGSLVGSTTSEPLQLKSLNYSFSTNGPTDSTMDKGRGLESPDHFMDESIRSIDSDKAYEDNHSFNPDPDDKHGLALYGPAQKPEWKRYKQYTRNDIMAAIDAVRTGMSALQAARKFGVPSRTLYDKVKKLGITTNRPYRKGSFPMSPYQGLNQKMDDGSGYSPEDQPLDISISSTGNGNCSMMLHPLENDSDKMDSDPGSMSIKQENSPPLDEKDDSNHGHHHVHRHHHEEINMNAVANGSEVCHSTSPRDREPSENEELRSGSD